MALYKFFIAWVEFLRIHGLGLAMVEAFFFIVNYWDLAGWFSVTIPSKALSDIVEQVQPEKQHFRY